jgi:hypothetical protein
MGKGTRQGLARERTEGRGGSEARETSAAPDLTASRLAIALTALGAWTIIVPFLGHPLGFGVKVSTIVEVVDHVFPGLAVAATGGWLAVLSRRRSVAGQWPAMLGGSVCFLAGWWVLATHIPLLSDASDGTAQWGTALWHASTSLPIIIVSLWFVLRSQGGDGEHGGPRAVQGRKGATANRARRRG